MKETGAPISEYIKVRRYVMNLIYRAGSKSVQIPTLTELSAMFGVSRPTVIKALKELTGDGYIIARPHHGSFTNPMKSFERQGMNRMPVIGLLHTDGMLTHYTPYYAEQLAHLLLGCAQIPAVVHQIQLNSRQPEQIIRSIESEALDLLVWVHPTEKQKPLVDKLRENRLKVITTGLFDESEWNVTMDFYHAGYEIGKECIKRNLRNPLLVRSNSSMTEIDGFFQAYSDAGIKLSEQCFLPLGDGFEALTQRLTEKNPPDILFCVLSGYEKILQKLEEIKPDFRETLFLIFPNVTVPLPCQGLTYLYPLKKNAEVITEMIRRLLNLDVADMENSVQVPVEIRSLMYAI